MLPYRTLVETLVSAPHEKKFVTMWHGDGDERSITFREFRLQAEAYSELFGKEGAQSGDRVILIMRQGIDLMAAFVGAMLCGAVPAIVAYPNFKIEPAKYRFGLSGVTNNLHAKMVLLDGDFPLEFCDHVAVGGDTKVVLGAVPQSASTPCMSLPNVDPSSIAFIQHSAGTTGLQKGVALSHDAVLRQLDHLINELRISDTDVVYSWLPLYHDMGLIACFILPLVMHLHVAMQDPTDWVMQPYTMLEVISRHRCTLAWVPNFTYQFLARRTDPSILDGIDLSSIRALINCSEPVKFESMKEFADAFGRLGFQPAALQTSYAMAENVFAVTQSDIGTGPTSATIDSSLLTLEHRVVIVPRSHPKAATYVSSGRCLPENRVRIVGQHGQDLPARSVGEILIQSDSMLTGYHNRPDLTAQAVRDGWYWSGDLGFLLNEELFVIGRKKDLIIIAGKNIYPQDVEAIICSHPAVHDGRAVAFGIYNNDIGTEDLVAVAEVTDERDLENAAAIERTSKAAIAAELGIGLRTLYLKPPRWIVKSTAGKPARSTTREKLIKEHPELSGISKAHVSEAA